MIVLNGNFVLVGLERITPKYIYFNLGGVSSPLCVNELRLDCSLTQLCQYEYIYWLILVQLHVSAFIGHLQVVLRDVDEFY